MLAQITLFIIRSRSTCLKRSSLTKKLLLNVQDALAILLTL
jgi:hypothetical protein